MQRMSHIWSWSRTFWSLMKLRVRIKDLFPRYLIQRHLPLLLLPFTLGHQVGLEGERPLLLVPLPRHDLAHLLRRVPRGNLQVTHLGYDLVYEMDQSGRSLCLDRLGCVGE